MKKVLLVLGTVILGFFAFFAYKTLSYPQTAQQEELSRPVTIELNENDSNVVSVPSSQNDASNLQQDANPNPTLRIEDISKPIPLENQTELDKFKQMNSDVVGWVRVPNTRINYPVVLTDNNEYYLDHNVERKRQKAGAVFMDFRNNDEDKRKHLILYGHNMKSGSMFHDLTSYKSKDFFDNNRKIVFSLDGETYEYTIYAAYIVQADAGFIQTSFNNNRDFVDYMQKFRSQSKFQTNEMINESDQVLTLSTCTYEYDDSRFVVQAKRTMG